MNADLFTYQKIGLMVHYVMLANADFTVWKTLPLDVRSERVKLATELVYVIYGIDFIPEVVIEDSAQGLWGGCCAMGGKIIKYKTNEISDYGYTHEVICHETRHAFQHFAIMNYEKSYKDEYGITEAMVKEWAENQQFYSDLVSLKGVDFGKYKHQVVEADANAFATDCKKAVENCLYIISED